MADTAANAGPLIDPVLAGHADMTIADLHHHGSSSAVTAWSSVLAGAGIERATGWRPAQPLNGSGA